MLAIGQEALASRLGGGSSQKEISLIESKESIEPAQMEKVANALRVSGEAIKCFSQEAACNAISNAFSGYLKHYIECHQLLSQFQSQG